MEEDQFGFRKGRDTRDAIVCLWKLGGRNSISKLGDVGLFYRLRESFQQRLLKYYRVFQNILLESLKVIGVDGKDKGS